MIVDLFELKHQLESEITEENFNKEISQVLDATILLIEYLEKHLSLVNKVNS